MLEPIKVTVKEETYFINTPNAYDATFMGLSVVQAIGPLVITYASLKGIKIGSIDEKEKNDILEYVAKSLKDLDPRVLADLIKDLLSKGIAKEIEGKPIAVSMKDFPGDLGSMILLVVHIIKSNYMGFFSDVLTGLPEILQK